MRRARRAAGVLVLALAPATAAASPLFELVGAAQGPGGLNARATSAHAASAYFNPAFLPDAEEGFDLGLFVASDQISIRLHGRPAGADIPEASVDMERPGGGRYPQAGLPTRWLAEGRAANPPDEPFAARPRQRAGSSGNTRLYQIVGLVTKLLGGRVGVGLTAMVPYRRFTSAQAFYNDEREQYFSNSLHPELYSDRLTTTSLAFALGARFSPAVAIGVGASLGLHTTARTPTYVDDVGRFRNIKLDSEVGVETALAPHVGALLRLAPGTELTLTVHTPQKIEIETDFSFLLANGVEQRADVGFTHAYVPWILGIGARQQLTGSSGAGLALVATATLAFWSEYRDRHSERPASTWSDTVTGAVGLRHDRAGATSYLDLAFVPSPVPDQTGRSNYVDNHRVAAVLGYARALGFKFARLRAGVALSAHRLLPREVMKAPGGVIDEVPDDAVVGGQPLPGREGLQTNNPGWPGFASEGWIFGGSVSLGVGF